jgi:hypothetical protein
MANGSFGGAVQKLWLRTGAGQTTIGAVTMSGPAEKAQAVFDFCRGQEHSAVIPPKLKGRDQQVGFADVGRTQFVDDPENAMHSHTARDGNLPQVRVACQ